jgi:hypothetical protein
MNDRFLALPVNGDVAHCSEGGQSEVAMFKVLP